MVSTAQWRMDLLGSETHNDDGIFRFEDLSANQRKQQGCLLHLLSEVCLDS